MPCVVLVAGASDGVQSALLPLDCDSTPWQPTTARRQHQVAMTLPSFLLIRVFLHGDSLPQFLWRTRMVKSWWSG